MTLSYTETKKLRIKGNSYSEKKADKLEMKCVADIHNFKSRLLAKGLSCY